MPRIDTGEPVTVRKDDLDTLIAACLRYLPGMPDDPDPDIRAAFIRLNGARYENDDTDEEPASIPAPVPPGRYGRVEIPGYRENEGWISEETRFGLQVAVVRDRDGTETAAVGVGPLCRVVWLPVPAPQPEPLALTAGEGWDDDDYDYDEPLRWRDD